MRTTILLLVLPLLFSCSMSSEEEGKQAIAKVKDKYLYLEDMEGVVPQDATKEDSTLIVGNYIQGWIKENLILQKAELNLKESQKDFEKQLEDYRKSLIIYSYEKELIKQKLDTTVGLAEIKEFYEATNSNSS